MAVKKIEQLNIHTKPDETNNDYVGWDEYITDNFEKIKETINNNADELTNSQEKGTTNADEITKIRKEQKIQLTTVTISSLIEKETEYTLPLNYKVGNHSLRVHWENVLLEEGQDGNYMEVGDKDSISNKIKFGWDIEPRRNINYRSARCCR